MVKIVAAIQQGAMAFLRAPNTGCSRSSSSSWRSSSASGALHKESHPLVAVAFIAGALCSALAGLIGMKVATKANVRTTQAARRGLGPALEIAFAGGSVMGMSVVGLGLMGLTGLMLVYTKMFGMSVEALRDVVLPIVTGYSMGASSIALFARVGGGIYTKAADVGADLVGKSRGRHPRGRSRATRP